MQVGGPAAIPAAILIGSIVIGAAVIGAQIIAPYRLAASQEREYRLNAVTGEVCMLFPQGVADNRMRLACEFPTK